MGRFRSSRLSTPLIGADTGDLMLRQISSY
jgi:hypothetical protein